MIRQAQASIDYPALAHNFQRVRQLAPHSRIMAVIKADAYGHGMVGVAKHLPQADAFAVACLAEATALRQAGITQPITVLQGFQHRDELAQYAAMNLRPVVHQVWQVSALESFVGKISPWLKINTGMGRLGVALEQAVPLWSRLKACESAVECGLMSHFANADEPGHIINQQQISAMRELAQHLSAPLSMANSGGLVNFPEIQADWVRPGIMLYGSSPTRKHTAAELDLRAVMKVSTQLIAINWLRAGEHIGYGSLWHCPEDMPVGVAAIGYGDGYPRHARSGTPVLVNEQRTQILGRVSMDSIVIDLRGLMRPAVGDEVVLWSNELSVDEIAQHAETISYELLCNMKGCVAPG
ncbi:MAG: alanine racemase [Pseudomonadota bacterium]|nr:alanine racemase [Pseudomonadota bacterium]